jgi:hypothetical protein
MKRIAVWMSAAAALAAASWAYGAAQSSPAAQETQPGQSEYPSTQPAPAPQSQPGDEPAPAPSSAPPSSTLPPDSAPPSRDSSSATSSSRSVTGPVERQSIRLAALVPAGMSAEEACAGFKSLRECATALHAAHNLNVPFADLKSKLTGGGRLTAAIHELKPEANAKEEARKAEGQARNDLEVAPPRG